jgi:hypothetical protein
VPKRLRAPDPLAIKPAVQHFQGYINVFDDRKVRIATRMAQIMGAAIG